MPVPVVLGNEAVFDDEDSLSMGIHLRLGHYTSDVLAGADVLVSVLVLARILVGQRC